MALITTIDGIPLYTTIQEALSWAMSNNLTGYHQHIYKEQPGYMGGESHEEAVQGPIVTPIPQLTPTPTTITTPPTYTGGGGGTSGGGGY